MSRYSRAFRAAICRQATPLRCSQAAFWFKMNCAIAMALGVALRPVDAGAKSLDLLARMLIPGYVAQDFATLCVSNNPQFLATLPESASSIGAFAQHLKIEITIGLTQREALDVMVAAADKARAVARKQLRDLAGADQSATDVSIRAWCDGDARLYILRVVAEHLKKHGTFSRLVSAAKQ